VGEASKSVWVDIRTTQQVVAVGLRTILERADGPLEVTFEGPVAGGQPDVVLYDVINLNDANGVDLDHLLKHTVSTVIAIDRTLRPDLGTRAKEKGVEWAITLDIAPEELVEVIHDAVSGNLEDGNNVAQEWAADRFLGSAAGISPRESEILQLVVMGHSNQEIADMLFLSINSVKTYIRSTYRKINTTSRGQAIVWAIQNGFLTERYDEHLESQPAP
jgi:NarL family two-component system response regulator LiaR